MKTLVRWVVALLALNLGAFMLFDGIRAFWVGDYLTPSSGEYAGQLGPWASLVESIGIEPRSALMKSLFIAYGLAWLVTLVAFLRQSSGSRRTMAFLAVATSWYLVPGTVSCVLLLLALGLSRDRAR